MTENGAINTPFESRNVATLQCATRRIAQSKVCGDEATCFLARRKGSALLGHRKRGTYAFAHLGRQNSRSLLFWEIRPRPPMSDSKLR